MVNKRQRRTQAEMLKLRHGLVQIVEEHRPLTVRHIFYLAIAAYLIEKTEAAYKGTIVKLIGEMREDWLKGVGWLKTKPVIPFGSDYIVDAGRWIRKPESHESVEDCLRDTAEYYRRALWSSLPVQVHVFCEKDAIADLVYRETADYDVPLAVMRGDSSKTFLYECAQAIEAADKPAFLYGLVDADDKGRQIIKSAIERICRYATGADISWEILAITEEQIERYNLPTRPEKKDHSRHAVEIDALPPEVLRRLIRAAIEQHLPQRELDVLRAAEKSERDLMLRIAGNVPLVRELLDSAHGE